MSRHFAHKPPTPEPDDEPIPDDEPEPEEDPVPHPDPVSPLRLLGTRSHDTLRLEYPQYT